MPGDSVSRLYPSPAPCHPPLCHATKPPIRSFTCVNGPTSTRALAARVAGYR
jgi:hypothetical protein